MIYSPQMLNLFEECAMKYYLRFVKNTQIPQLDNTFTVGKNIHAIAAYYLKGEDISMFSLSQEEESLWNTLTNNKLFKLKPECIETNIAYKIDDFWIGGRLDALVKNNNEYYILDYKTGKIPQNAKYNFQTIVYLLCCANKLKHEYKKLSFAYISVKTNETELIELTEELEKEYIERIKQTVTEIKKLYEPNKHQSTKCKLCQYNKICV